MVDKKLVSVMLPVHQLNIIKNLADRYGFSLSTTISFLLEERLKDGVIVVPIIRDPPAKGHEQ